MAQTPKELLYLFRNLDDWHEPHSERHLVSIPGNVSLLDLHLQLPHDINAFAFSKYVKIYLRGRSLFATKEIIRAPFLPKQTSLDQKDSLEAFSLILMYTTDTDLTEKRRRLVADMLIQKGLSSELLRDEILIQLCNQTLYSGNGFCDPSSVWILMAGCLGSFQPSQSLAKYLLKYVSDTKSSQSYGVVCQQKLLQSQGIDMKCPRSYPPCILEWTAIRMKSCIALSASFVDGVTIKGQVESWTTAEQFASNLLQSRRASSGCLGWCVVLRDDRESYECAGYDYVLDLISEIEVVPGFPCGTAYFIATSDLSRPTNQVSGRNKWPDQPHTADRLRLMSVDVDELPDSGLFAAVRMRSPPPLVVSPRSSSVVSSTLSSPYETIRTPETPPIRPEDIYASRNEALSQVSILNKRSDKVPAILSKSSALNSRYHLANDLAVKKPQVPQSVPAPAGKAPPVNGVGPGRPAPGGRQNGRGLAPSNEEDMDAWLESVFRGVVNDGGVDDLRNSRAIERRLKGGGDDLPSQLSMPFGGFGLGYGLSQMGLQQPMTTPIFSQPIVSQPIISPSILSQPYASQQFLPSSLQPSYLSTTTSAIPGLAPLLSDHSYLYQQQQQQQQQRQQMLSQQTAELQVRLQQQELEKKVMQSSLETEILRHQLLQVQEQTRPTAAGTPRSSSSRDATPTYQIQPNSTKYPARKTVPARTHQEIEEEEEEEGDESDFQEPQERAVKTRVVPVSEREPISVPKKKVSVVTRHRNAEETSPPHPIIRNTTNGLPEEKTKGVTFNTQLITIPPSPDTDNSSSSLFAAASATHAPPPPPPPTPPHPSLTKTIAVSSLKDERTGKVGKTVTAVGSTAAAATATAAASASKADDVRPASGAIGSQRRPPARMGQIVWPPKPKEEETKPKYEPGRLMIDETKENQGKVQPKQTPEEIQRKVSEKIQMAKKMAVAEADKEEEARRAKQAAPKKRPSLPSTGELSSDQTSPNDYHTLDMRTRQEALEKQLVSVAWGTQKKSVAPKAVAFAAVPLPPPPPPPPPPAPPVTDQVEVVAEVRKQQMTPFDLNSMDNIRTVLYAQCTEPFYTYHNVNWTLEIRKEFFRPMEKLADPDLLYLVFCQIVFDVSSNDCIRLGKDDRQKMAALLDKFNIHRNNVTANHSQITMMAVIDAAKTLPIYFSRIYAVNGGKHLRKVQMLAIGHSGVRLLTRFKDVCDDYIEVVENIGFSEIQNVVVPKEGALVIRIAGKHFALYSPRANQICKMIEQLRTENNKILQAAKNITALDSSMSSLYHNFPTLNKN